MRYSLLALAAASTTVYAQNACQDAYNSCLAAGTEMVVCQCKLYTCSGEDPQRIRDYCSTATAGLTTASMTTAAAYSSSAAATCATPFAGTIAQPSGAPQITACAGSLPLGAACGADEQCANGAKCYGTTAFTIRTCGSFNAQCSSDAQCATNTCNNGSCSGFKASSSSSAPMTTTKSTASASASCAAPGTNDSYGQYSCNPAHQYPEGQTCILKDGCFVLTSTSASMKTMSATGSVTAYMTSNGTTAAPTTMTASTMGGAASASKGTTSPASTSSPVPYTGSASLATAFSGLGALVAGIAAFVI